MKTRIFAFLGFRSWRFPQAQEFFRSIGRNDLAESAELPAYLYTFQFDSEADYLAFRAEAAAFGFADDDFSVRKEFLYTPSELEAGPLLRMMVDRAPKGLGGPTYGTEYDLANACPVCGTGAVQTSPLYLRGGDPPKTADIFKTLDNDVLVSPKVAEAFLREQVTGAELRQAIGHKDREPLPWFQLVCTHELPRMSGLSKLSRDDPCRLCSRDGYYDLGREPSRIVYDASQVNLDELPDFSCTWERVGKSVLREPFKKSHLASPLLVVKPRVYKIFRQLKVRGAVFEPVHVVERAPP